MDDRASQHLGDGCLPRGINVLLRAHKYARSVDCCVWDFAVEIERLREAGLSECDFRFLSVLKYTEHAREITSEGEDGRVFRPVGDLSFPAGTCFVLTAKGVAFAEAEMAFIDESSSSPLLPPPERRATPCWDSEIRELRVEGELVKQFRWPAVNQERILAAFEEDGWSAHIDDPLPPQAGVDPRRRLHDTIKGLNKKQREKHIQFRGDGTGEGVIWELSEPPDCAE